MVEFRQPGKGPHDVAQEIVDELTKIDGMNGVQIAEQRPPLVEFYMPEQDPKYPSVIAIGDNSLPREITIRLAPLGHREETTEARQHDLEGKWVDAVLDSLSDAGLLDQIGDDVDIDIGDAWISPLIRPHLRLHERERGYKISPREIRLLVDALARNFEARFGTLEKMYTERPEDYRM